MSKSTSGMSLRQLRVYRAVDGQEPDVPMPDGGKYYGEVSAAADVATLAGQLGGTRGIGGRFPHGNGVLISADGSRYGGEWRAGSMHGNGSMITDVFEYEGEWETDKMHGFGTIHYKETGITSGLAGAFARGLTTLSPFEQKHKPLEYRGEFHKTYHRHGKGVMTYRNSDTYDGEWSSNRRHGQGTFRSHAGDKYVGSWVEDERCGEGTVSYANGGVYHGQMMGDRRCGHGTLVHANGDEFTGNFDGDKMEGFGICKYRNGDKYEGNWHEGLRHGEGTFYLEKRGAIVRGNFAKGLLNGRGSVEFPGKSFFIGDFEKGERLAGVVWNKDEGCYCGEWRGDTMQGKGIMWYSGGEFYYGYWQHNQRHGTGSMNFPDGAEFSGDFVDDKRKGKGILKLADGTIHVGVWDANELTYGYIGEWNGRCFAGAGRLIYPSGDEYIGLFANGLRHGAGEIHMVDGTIYRGEWAHDFPHGRGTMQYASGEIYDGDWAAGLRCGNGTCVSKEGRLYQGEWLDDVPHGTGSYFEVDLERPIYEEEPPQEAPLPAAEDDKEGKADDAPAKSASFRPFAAAAWLATSIGSKFQRNPTASTPTPEAQEKKRRIIGYEPFYSFTGTFVNGSQRGQGHLYHADGRRTIAASWIECSLKLEMPHRGNVIQPADHPACSFCGAAFGFFKKQLNCALCARASCASCLKDLSPVPKCVYLDLLENDSLNRSGTITPRADAPKVSLPPPASTISAAGSSAVGFLSNPFRSSAAAQATGAQAESVRTCADCYQCVQLNLVKIAMWEKVYVTRIKKQTRQTSSVEIGSMEVMSSNSLSLGPTGDDAAPAPVLVDPVPRGSSGSQSGSRTAAVAGDEARQGNGSLANNSSLAAQGEVNDSMVQCPADFEDPNTEELTLCYKGFCAGSSPHISGTIWSGVETCYHGDMRLGDRDGFGTISHQNGEEYVGNWHCNKPHQLGKYRSKDGTVYEGVWKDGRLIRLIYRGETTDDLVREGTGMAFYEDGSRFNGCWRNGKRHGTGIMQFADGSIYTGEFMEDTIAGHGRLVQQDTGIHVGEFSNNVKHGPGVERNDDRIIEGVWNKGVLSGHVVVRNLADRSMYEGVWDESGNERGDIFVRKDPVPDASVSQCGACNSSFGMFLRRHHCRRCGGVFCDPCSKRRIDLPKHFLLPPGSGDQHRVCMKCFVMVSERCSIGIHQDDDGQLYAGLWSKGTWSREGLLRKPDGTILITANGDFSSCQPATEADIIAFKEWWLDTTHRCGINELPLRVEPVAFGEELERLTSLRTDLSVEISLFDEKEERSFVPSVVPMQPMAPPSPPERPYNPMMVSDDAFQAKVQVRRQTDAESLGISDEPLPPFNYGTPPKPAEREYRQQDWTHWEIAKMPSYNPQLAAAIREGRAESSGDATAQAQRKSSFLKKVIPVGSKDASSTTGGFEMPQAAVPIGKPGVPTFPKVESPPVLMLHLKPLEGPCKIDAIVQRRGVTVMQEIRQENELHKSSPPPSKSKRLSAAQMPKIDSTPSTPIQVPPPATRHIDPTSSASVSPSRPPPPSSRPPPASAAKEHSPLPTTEAPESLPTDELASPQGSREQPPNLSGLDADSSSPLGAPATGETLDGSEPVTPNTPAPEPAGSQQQESNDTPSVSNLSL